MSELFDNLKKLSDEELVRRHDEIAVSTMTGVTHYLDELRAREGARINTSVMKMTKVILVCTVVITIATLAQLYIVSLP